MASMKFSKVDSKVKSSPIVLTSLLRGETVEGVTESISISDAAALLWSLCVNEGRRDEILQADAVTVLLNVLVKGDSGTVLPF